MPHYVPLNVNYKTYIWMVPLPPRLDSLKLELRGHSSRYFRNWKM